MKRIFLAQLVIFTVMCTALAGDATLGRCPLLVDSSLSPAFGVAVSGDHVFVGAGPVFKVIDVSEPLSPVVVGSVVLSHAIFTIIVEDDYAYVWTWEANLRVIDVSDPRVPRKVGTLDAKGNSEYPNAVVSGGYAFVSAASNFSEVDPVSQIRVIDLRDPFAPIEVASPGIGYGALSVSGSRLYVLSSNSTESIWSVEIYDVSDPEEPVGLGSYRESAHELPFQIVTEGSLAYVSTRSGLSIIDATDPSAPFKAGAVDLQYIRFLAVSDGFVYAHMNTYFDVIDARDPSNPIGVGSCTTPYTYASPSQLVVSGDHVYISHTYQGLVVVDVSLPYEPYVAMQMCEGWPHSVEVSGKYAYWSCSMIPNRSVLRISDLSDHLKGNEIGLYETEDRLGKVAASGSFAYVAADSAGLLVIDVSDPTEPREVGSFRTGGKILDLTVRDGYAYLLMGRRQGFRILDVSDPSNPREVAWRPQVESGVTLALAVSGDYAYISMSSSLIVIDISDPSAPREVAFLESPGGAIAISGPYAYLAAGGYGLRVIDIREPLAPYVVGALELFTWNPNEPELAISVAVSRRRAFIVTRYGGLHVVDISDPHEPYEVQFVPDFYMEEMAVSGRYAVLAKGQGGSSIFDISGCMGRIYRARDGHRDGQHRQ